MGALACWLFVLDQCRGSEALATHWFECWDRIGGFPARMPAR
jgi:hypothetical protein